jgi:hypothetical protein
MTKKKKNPSRYIPPEILPITYCSAVLSIVLENNEKAKTMYEELINCFDSTGLQEIALLTQEELPDLNTLLKQLVKESGFDTTKPVV